MTIRYKLILGICVILIPILLVGAASIFLIEERVEHLESFHTPALSLVQEFTTYALQAVQESLAYIASGEKGEKEEFMQWAESSHLKLNKYKLVSKQIREHFHEGQHEVNDKKPLLLDRIEANHSLLILQANVLIDEFEKSGKLSKKSFIEYEDIVDELFSDLDELIALEKVAVDEARVEAFGIIRQNKRIILSVGLMSLLLSIVSGYYLNRSISIPLSNLRSAAESIAQGKFDQKLDITSSDEIGELSNSFNNMASDLGDYSNNLEKLVEERTDQLAKTNEALKTEIIKNKDSLKEKEVLLKEIHHRVKNNLQIVTSMLDLQSKYIDDSSYKEILKESHNRIGSMALIHEQLYQSPNLAIVDTSKYIKRLKDRLLKSYGAVPDRVRVNINSENVDLDIDTAIPCGLIINELISNSLKHAFHNSREGEINVELIIENGEIVLRVCDNGVGLPDGFDFQSSKTLGLRLVNILTDQLKGRLEVINSGGTEVKITFMKQI